MFVFSNIHSRDPCIFPTVFHFRADRRSLFLRNTVPLGTDTSAVEIRIHESGVPCRQGVKSEADHASNPHSFRSNK